MSTTAYQTGGYVGDAADLPQAAPSQPEVVHGENIVHRAPSGSSYAEEKGAQTDQYVHHASDDDAAESKARRAAFYKRFRPLILAGVAAVILGWWISSTVLLATRHRW